LFQDFGNLPADTDVGLWLFILDEEEADYNQENDSILEVRQVTTRKRFHLRGEAGYNQENCSILEVRQVTTRKTVLS
jgi:hypothetical protein